MAAETKLVLIRRSLTLPFGMDLIDSRDGIVLAWARLHTAYVLADRVNETYPDPDLARDGLTLSLEMSSQLRDLEGGGDGEDIAARFMLPSRERLEFVEVLAELIGWVGRRVSVDVGRPGDAGTASFTATLIGVDSEPEAQRDDFVLVRFEDGPGFVDLDPEAMTAFGVRLEAIGIRWLEFDKRGSRAVAIRPLKADEAGGES